MISMTDNAKIWKTIREQMPKQTWIPIADIFRAVETNISLDKEDLDTTLSRNNIPRWHSNVRHLLRKKKEAGRLHARPKAR
jgi:hypothetical protein